MVVVRGARFSLEKRAPRAARTVAGSRGPSAVVRDLPPPGRGTVGLLRTVTEVPGTWPGGPLGRMPCRKRAAAAADRGHRLPAVRSGSRLGIRGSPC